MAYSPVLLPGKSHGWRSLVGCSPWGHTERLHFHFPLLCIGEGNGNPLQRSCLENPRDGGAWWADVYRVGHDWSDLAAAAFYRTQTFIEGVPGMGTIIYRTLSWKIARKIWKQHYAQLGDTRIFDICLCKIKEHCKCKLLLCNAMCKALDFSWRHLSLGMHSLLTCIPLNTNTIKNFLSKSVG